MRVTAIAPFRSGFARVTLLSPLLRRRAWSAAVCATALIHLGLVRALGTGLVCPIHELSHVPCPGCGLTVAMMHLLRGEWMQSFLTHPFAAVFLAGLLLFGLNTLLPDQRRQRLADSVMRWEQRTGGAAVFLAALLLYGVVRIC